MQPLQVIQVGTKVGSVASIPKSINLTTLSIDLEGQLVSITLDREFTFDRLDKELQKIVEEQSGHRPIGQFTVNDTIFPSNNFVIDHVKLRAQKGQMLPYIQISANEEGPIPPSIQISWRKNAEWVVRQYLEKNTTLKLDEILSDDGSREIVCWVLRTGSAARVPIHDRHEMFIRTFTEKALFMEDVVSHPHLREFKQTTSIFDNLLPDSYLSVLLSYFPGLFNKTPYHLIGFRISPDHCPTIAFRIKLDELALILRHAQQQQTNGNNPNLLGTLPNELLEHIVHFLVQDNTEEKCQSFTEKLFAESLKKAQLHSSMNRAKKPTQS